MNSTNNLAYSYTDAGVNTAGNVGWHGLTPINERTLHKNISTEKVAAMCMVITVVSFLGFWVENIFISITGGYMDNRNMMLPFLLGYGLAIMAIYMLFGTPKAPKFFGFNLKSNNKFLNILSFFGITFLCVSIGEIVLGTFVEKTCGIVWWNYSDIPLHLTKYTSVPTSMGFAFLITVFMGCFLEPLYRRFAKMNKKALYTLAIVFMILLIGDFLFSGIRMFETGELMKIWRFEL